MNISCAQGWWLPTIFLAAVGVNFAQGLTGTTSVTFNGLAAISFTVVSDPYMTTFVPTGATTGAVVVTTPGGR